MMKALRTLVALLTVVFGIFLSACGDEGSGSNSNSGGTTQATGTVGSAGGTIEVTDSKSAILGTKVIVPQDAVDSSETVQIKINYEDQLPSQVESGTVAASKTIVLTKDSSYKFKQPVTVTIPYTDAQMEGGDIPAVFYWDATSSTYVAVGVKNIDTTNKTITFTTSHFTSFVALSVKGLAKSFFSIDTGFRPGTDGFFHPNFGAYDSPGGSSLGMANYSEWYFQSKKAINGNGLFTKYLEGDPARWEDDTTARELIARSFIASSQIWANLWLLTDYALSEVNTGLLLITTMKITKAPQTFLLKGGSNFSQAVTVYEYDSASGKFHIYDNNFPNEQVTVDWSPFTGFSNYSKAAAYPSISKFGFEAFSSAFQTSEFETLYQGAESGWSNSKFQQINITAPSLDASNTATVSLANNVTVTGTVTGGTGTAKYLVYNVNGTNASGLSGQLVTLGGGGSFSFAIANLPSPNNSIMMMTTDDPKDATRRVPNAYAGFKEITLKVQGQTFFANLGFEKGIFTDWNSETHTWQNVTRGSFTPQKSGIENAGADPIDTAIQKVYKGQYSARINNYDNGYHISSVSQTATVPNVPNPQLKFYWAAILEDPGHNPGDQPYVDILVKDETSGAILYSKHFYSNDPSYSGWRVITRSSYGAGNWKTIPWQLVTVDVANAGGHQVTITVSAADCALGAHGGYAYLDGDE